MNQQNFSVVGDDVVGAAAARAMQRRGQHHAHPAAHLAPWLDTQIAPGVYDPGEGLQVLPLRLDTGASYFVFDSTHSNCEFIGRPQKPFRGERLLFSVRHSSASDAVIVLGTLSVGTEPQQAQVGSFDVEQYGAQAFGVRLAMLPASPGIDITMQLQLSGALAGTDTITVTAQILGRMLR